MWYSDFKIPEKCKLETKKISVIKESYLQPSAFHHLFVIVSLRVDRQALYNFIC